VIAYYSIPSIPSIIYYLIMEIFLGAALGTMIGLLLAFPAIILETSRRVKNLPLLIDVYTWRGKKLTDGEVFVVGLLLHLITAGLYGLLYVLFAKNDFFLFPHDPYSLLSMIVFALVLWFWINIVILPLIGLGFFGNKEGGTVWFETLISLLLEGSILWMIIQYYQPIYFV